MRRTRDRRPASLFRGAELPRLMTMVVMLGVLFLLFDLARDQRTWRWIAPGALAEAPAAEAADRLAISADDGAHGGLTDLDSLERDAAREEFGAVTDKTPLGKEEMPAYWRLMAWEQHQSTAELRQRAAKDVSFRELWQQPDKWRGRLVELPLHLGRTAKVEELADNELGMKTLYEVWGWNSNSQPYWYWLVCPNLPPGMPEGAIQEEVTFVGYFLKLIPYEDHQGKTLAAPLLIGTLVWHPIANGAPESRDDWTRWAYPVVIVVGVLVVLQAWMSVAWRRRKAALQRALQWGSNDRTVESWLDHAEEAVDADIAASGGHESPGSAGPPFNER